MSDATVKELLEILCSGLDWETLPVVMPLVTQLAIISPDDVIGFGVTDLKSGERRCVIIKGRDWEANAQWTGMTADLYTSTAVDELDAVAAMREILREWGACLSYAGRMTVTAFQTLNIGALVVPMTSMARFAEIGHIPADVKKVYEETASVPVHTLLKSIADHSMPRMLNRTDLMRRLLVPATDMRDEVPVMDASLMKDVAIWKRCLEMPATTGSCGACRL